VYVLVLSIIIFCDRNKRQEEAGFLSTVTYGLDRIDWVIIDVLSIYVCMYNVQDTVENDKHICTTGLWIACKVVKKRVCH